MTDEMSSSDDATPTPNADDLVEARTRAPGSLAAGWAYLAFLTLIALGAIGWALLTDSSVDNVATGVTESSSVDGVANPVTLNLEINGHMVNLTGEVPDQGAINQLVALAEARYGVGNVTSELTVNSGVTLVGGVVNVVGSAEEGDEGPNGLQSDVAAAFGLRAGAFDLTRTAAELTSVRADAEVAAGSITLSGAFPDAAARDQYVLAASEIYGADNVEFSGVTVDSTTTLNGALFGISGLVDAGDTRASDFQSKILLFFGGSNADTSGLEIDTSPEALARLEERLRLEVGAQPILFASGSAELDATSDDVLTRIAAAINATPGVNVEVVGHTDGAGGVEANQDISERRAQAVLDRLIELGVEEGRLRARGAGESEPIASNDTDDGKAANRRIEFEFEGAG